MRQHKHKGRDLRQTRKMRVQRLDAVQRSENWKRIVKKEEAYAISNDTKIRTCRDTNNSDSLRAALDLLGGQKRPSSSGGSSVMSSVSTRSSRTGLSSASFRTSTTTMAMRKIGELENVLNEERAKRVKAEKELSELREMVETLIKKT
jgi:hypothetical protein